MCESSVMTSCLKLIGQFFLIAHCQLTTRLSTRTTVQLCAMYLHRLASLTMHCLKALTSHPTALGLTTALTLSGTHHCLNQKVKLRGMRMLIKKTTLQAG